eukprot:3812549-Karenia_brevis.AAC.1
MACGDYTPHTSRVWTAKQNPGSRVQLQTAATFPTSSSRTLSAAAASQHGFLSTSSIHKLLVGQPLCAGFAAKPRCRLPY